MKTRSCLRTALPSAVGLAIWLNSAVGVEHLDRGVVALPRPDGSVYVGWRLLASDPPRSAFHVLRAESPAGGWQRLTAQPVAESCNFVDSTAAGKRSYYRVDPVGAEGLWPPMRPVSTAENAFLRLKLQGRYRAQKVGLADLDGDGQLDYLVKQPDFNTDPYQQPGY